jgi:primosomal protein N'
MLKLSARRKTESGADKAASTLADSLKKTKGVVVLGPAPGLKAKENNQYIRQIIVKSRDRKKLLAIAWALPAGWTADLDPTSLL